MAKIIEGEGLEQDVDSLQSAQEKTEQPPEQEYEPLEGAAMLSSHLEQYGHRYGLRSDHAPIKAAIMTYAGLVIPKRDGFLEFKTVERIQKDLGQEILKIVAGEFYDGLDLGSDEELLTNLPRMGAAFREVGEALTDLYKPREDLGPYTLAMGAVRSRPFLTLALAEEKPELSFFDQTIYGKREDRLGYIEEYCTPSTQAILKIAREYDVNVSVIFNDIRETKKRFREAWS